MIKGILSILVPSVIFLLVGNAFLDLIGWEKKPADSYSWGFVALLAVFQLIAYPLYRLNTSFSILFWLFTAVLAGLFLYSASRFLRDKNRIRQTQFYTPRTPLKTFLQQLRKYPFLSCTLFAAVLFLFFMGLGFYYSSSDEGYNLTRAMETITQNSLGLNEDMYWYGRDLGPRESYENASTYYYLISYLSVVFRIHPTILYKTFFPFVLTLLHLSAVSCAYDSVSDDAVFPKKALFFISYIIFQLLCVKASSAGTWITGYLYEGKAVMIAVVFPLLLAACAKIIRNADTVKTREWLSVAVVLTAGIELSIVGLFLPAILYFCMGAAFLIATKFRYFKRVWLPAVLSALPVIIYGFLSLLSSDPSFLALGGISADTPVQVFSVSVPVRTLLSAWKDHFLEAIDFWQFVLFLISSFYFCLFGTKTQKTVFTLSPFVLFLTFLNPLFSNVVSHYITTPIVYWRLWWLIPIYLSPAFAFADLCNRLTDGKPQNALLIIILTLGGLSGFEIFRTSIVSPEYTILPFVENVGHLLHVRPELRMNIYNLHPGPLRTAQAIEADWEGSDRPRVFMCFNRPFELRQYSDDIAMVTVIRNYDDVEGTIEGTDVLLRDFINNYGSVEDGVFLRDMLLRLDTDYVCFDEHPAVKNLDTYGFRHILNYAGIDLWRVLP